MDYVLNPLVCTILCARLTMNYLPWLPCPLGVVFFAALFTFLNLRGVKSSARTNQVVGIGLGFVVLVFLGAAPALPDGRSRSARRTSRGRSTIRRRSRCRPS